MAFDLTRELDKVKAKAFFGETAAFLAPIMCSMRFEWNTTEPTASTNGIDLSWNSDWFEKLPFDARVTVLMHELWHVARLHMLRCGSRDPEWWNYACDLWINNMLEKAKYSFLGLEGCWKDSQYDVMVEEDIYDAIYNQQASPPPPPQTGAFGDPGGGGDMKQASSADGNQAAMNDVLTTVVRAMHQAELSGAKPGSMPGDQKELIKSFLKPVVPWQRLLNRFFTDMLDDDYTWRRPNRRHSDIYLPSRFTDDGRLEHLAYYLDVSGSITKKDVLRFNSEVKHVKDFYNPEKMTFVQFDTRIAHEEIITENDAFDEVVVRGGGGTCLVPVRDHIIKHRPTAAIIFSDMEVAPMEKLPFDIPVIWVVIRNTRVKPPFGTMININQ